VFSLGEKARLKNDKVASEKQSGLTASKKAEERLISLTSALGKQVELAIEIS